VAQLRGELRLREGCIRDGGSELGRWRGKCLQRALLRAVGDRALRARLRTRLLQGCCDHAGAGLRGEEAELLNFLLVFHALVAEKVSVVVAGCWSSLAASQGFLDGCWEFGHVGGARVGVLLWCWGEQHVYAMRGVDARALAARPLADLRAPWFKSVVSGKKAKRPHLAKLNLAKARPRRAAQAASSDVDSNAPASSLPAESAATASVPSRASDDAPRRSVRLASRVAEEAAKERLKGRRVLSVLSPSPVCRV